MRAIFAGSTAVVFIACATVDRPAPAPRVEAPPVASATLVASGASPTESAPSPAASTDDAGATPPSVGADEDAHDEDAHHVAPTVASADPKPAPPSGKTMPPSLRGPCATSVNGHIPPKVIDRVVKQNMARFRLCYDAGKKKDPKLAGRVVVKFVIARNGAVSMTADGGSTLPDEGVVACIVRGFGSLSFPQPEGGIVAVVYPLDLP